MCRFGAWRFSDEDPGSTRIPWHGTAELRYLMKYLPPVPAVCLLQLESTSWSASISGTFFRTSVQTAGESAPPLSGCAGSPASNDQFENKLNLSTFIFVGPMFYSVLTAPEVHPWSTKKPRTSVCRCPHSASIGNRIGHLSSYLRNFGRIRFLFSIAVHKA